jgi:hypothetical protein
MILPFTTGILTVVLRYIGTSAFSVTVTLNISHHANKNKAKNRVFATIPESQGRKYAL